MRKDVYFDDEEKPLSHLDIQGKLRSSNMEELGTEFIQPPYSLEFVKKLNNWPFYFFGVELLYRLDNHLNLPLSKFFLSRYNKLFNGLRKRSASYFLSLYRKLP